MAEKEYFKKLDFIRIISCLLVLLYHLNIVKGGFLAVCTFFTLSGYLTCISVLGSKEFSIKAYYINKLKKMYFPLLIVVFVTLIVAKLNTNINWINLKPETNSVIWGYNNIWQLKANLDYFTRHNNSPFIHFWYISILMQFDIIFPIAFICFRKLNERLKKDISIIIVFLLNIITMVFFFYLGKTQDIMTVYYNTIARSFSIFFGVNLAILHYKYDIRFSIFFRKFNTLIFTLYLLVLIVLCMFVSGDSNYYAMYMILITIISYRLIDYSVLNNTKENRVIKILSKISYEVYLVQYPIIFFMQNVLISIYLKNAIIIVFVFIISSFLYWIINVKFTNKKIIIIRNFIFSLIIIIGSIILLLEKDNSAEMKELENLLDKNSQIIQEKNNNIDNLEIKNTDELIVDEINKENDLENNEKIEQISEKNNTDNIDQEDPKENFDAIDEAQIEEDIKNLKVVGVGDSILLGAINELYNTFPNGYFDGKISRTIKDSEEVLINLKNKDKLGNIVILNLANNGDYSEKRNKELMEILGAREIYWLNAVGADDSQFNERFMEFANDFPNIHIIEWEKITENHPEYFYVDGIHLKPSGEKAYAKAIYEAIYNDYLESLKTNK